MYDIINQSLVACCLDKLSPGYDLPGQAMLCVFHFVSVFRPYLLHRDKVEKGPDAASCAFLVSPAPGQAVACCIINQSLDLPSILLSSALPGQRVAELRVAWRVYY